MAAYFCGCAILEIKLSCLPGSDQIAVNQFRPEINDL